MRRGVKSATVTPPETNWWTNVYVLARKCTEGPYAPANVYWRRATTPHEAMLGLEEWHPEEPLRVPLSREKARERAKQKNAVDKRFFDIHIRMLYRAGAFEYPPENDCTWVESSPFPDNWNPMRPNAAKAN